MTGIGGPKSITDAIKATGGAVGPRLKWLGSWNLKSGIADWDAFFQGCKADGVTPEVYWFAWGDFISPTAITNGVQDTQQGVWKNQANLLPLLKGVMQKAKAAGVTPIVVMEGEFNKQGCEASPVFAKWWDACEAIVRTECPGSKVVFAMGNWGDIPAVVAYYAAQVAKSDYMGLQCVLFAPRHTAAAIGGIVGAKLAAGFQAMGTTKPKVIYDCALSAYGGAFATSPPFAGGDGKALEAAQRDGIASLASLQGLEFIVYRDLMDNPNMGLDQWGGWAERFVGVQRTDGTRKPAYDALVALAKAPGTAPAPAPAPIPPPEPTFTLAQMEAAKSTILGLQAEVQRLSEVNALKAKLAAIRGVLDGP